MIVISISDTHEKHQKVLLPEGDVLIHAGDATFRGDDVPTQKFLDWFGQQPHKHKILIAGNHDWNWQKNAPYWRKRAWERGITYLQDEEVVFDEVKFYGSPWQPEFRNWAFNLPRGPKLMEKWAAIPLDTNVLITHGPPFGIQDCVNSERVGCASLGKRVFELPELKLHVFGHIHAGYGQTNVFSPRRFVNASICDEQYCPTNAPIVVEI